MHRFLLLAVVLGAIAPAAPSVAQSRVAAEPADLALVSVLDARAELTALGPSAGRRTRGTTRRGCSFCRSPSPARGRSSRARSAATSTSRPRSRSGPASSCSTTRVWMSAPSTRTSRTPTGTSMGTRRGTTRTARTARRSAAYECRPLAEYGTQEYYEDIGKYDTYWGWWSASGSGSGVGGVPRREERVLGHARSRAITTCGRRATR